MAGYIQDTKGIASALAAIREGFFDDIDLSKVQTCNLSPEQIAEMNRPITRQERRKLDRLKKKGRKQ